MFSCTSLLPPPREKHFESSQARVRDASSGETRPSLQVSPDHSAMVASTSNRRFMCSMCQYLVTAANASTRRVVALDEAQHYAGLVMTSAIYADEDGEGKVSEYAVNQEFWLNPDMSIRDIMGVFDRTGSDELAVLDDQQAVLGVLTEAYATRRYAEELEKNRRDLVGGE